MKYYVIKNVDGEYYNDIAACFTGFDTMGSIFPPKHVDYVWWNYLADEDRASAAIYEITITETTTVYIPQPLPDVDNEIIDLGF